MRKTILFLICLCLLACTGCSAAPPDDSAPAEDTASVAASEAVSSEGQTYPVTITDFLGNTVEIESAQRIVSLAPSSTQVLMSLDAEDRIVGIDAQSEQYLPDIEVVGDYTGPDVEKITALAPDVVLAANNIQRGTIDQLHELGLVTVAAEPTSWDGLADSFRMLGQITDRLDAADALCAQLDEAVRNAQSAAPAEAPTCYYVLSYGDAGNWTSGEGSFINSMIEFAGGEPVTQGSPSPWLEYPIEDLVSADPDCIILPNDAGTVEDFSSTPGYENLTAVKQGHVFALDGSLVSVPGPILCDGLTTLSEIVNEAAEAPATAA